MERRGADSVDLRWEVWKSGCLQQGEEVGIRGPGPSRRHRPMRPRLRSGRWRGRGVCCPDARDAKDWLAAHLCSLSRVIVPQAPMGHPGKMFVSSEFSVSVRWGVAVSLAPWTELVAPRDLCSVRCVKGSPQAQGSPLPWGLSVTARGPAGRSGPGPRAG